ncbi:MAG: DUF1015 domain-containing protein [Clostridia bacterium]|nr:DUF1015 domain-containing protein [Clostridia bacterium]
MKKDTIFTGADILLPDTAKSGIDFNKWAVIACDQFTSDISYWNKTEEIISGAPSTYDYILPEAYLGTPREAEKRDSFSKAMIKVSDADIFKSVVGYVYIKRTLSDGKIRRGILGKLDLEEYDFSKVSRSNIRATEETVPDRIPPRSQLRQQASIELPHAMVFTDDVTGLFVKLESLAEKCEVIYDFDLMQGGGHITGYAIEGEAAKAVAEYIAENEAACKLPYAVGDGNHSLAAAKHLYEKTKAALGNDAADHPARYALCEIISIYDEAVEFEPIHRILKNVDVTDVINSISKIASIEDGDQRTRVITSNSESVYSFLKTSHDMTVGTLQNFIDAYVSEHPGAVCDYIHGEEELRALVDESSVAFMFDGFDKSMLFSYIKNGPMPRKTFSMGDARSKRYYLEARRIIK